MKFSGILIGGWVAASAALSLAGCSGSPESGSGNPASTTAPSQTSTIETGGAPDDCATGAEIAEQMSDPRVRQVEVAGDCRSVAVSTGLADDQADLAVLVCDAAAALASAGAMFSRVSVTGENDGELATGGREKPCVAA